MISKMHAMVERFNREVIGLWIPPNPIRLSRTRKIFAVNHLREELDEFAQATNLQDEADAMIDFAYIALGRLVEMGIAPGPVFEEVHLANMKKERGTRAKRPGSEGHDAVKPKGWKPPDLMPYLLATRDELLITVRHQDVAHLKPKLLVIGHGRHGKDTVCEMLRDRHGFTFTSSSMFCAEHVMFPLLSEEYGYRSVSDCYDDRHNHRDEWFDAIRDYNRPDASALARDILEDNDVYCGMRSSEELEACQQAGLFDAIIWVDRSDHEPPEDKSSCTVTEDMATHHLNNNGTLDDLVCNLDRLMRAIL